MNNWIKCSNIEFISERKEEFYDVSLNVKNMKNLYESFNMLIQVKLFLFVRFL